MSTEGHETTERSAGETAVVLIDFENFFRGRELRIGVDRRVKGGVYDSVGDIAELDALVTKLASGRRVIVRRAYADFDAKRRGHGTMAQQAVGDYMRGCAQQFMKLGIEPVQLYPYPGGVHHKNAADVRMVVDAMSLAGRAAHIHQFILVSGDCDFIPLAVELRQRGSFVDVVGGRGASKEVWRKYCDRFSYFEDFLSPVAKDEANSDHVFTIEQPPPRPKLELAEVRDALRRIIEREGGVYLSQLPRHLNIELARTFLPTAFGHRKMGKFMRAHASYFGVQVERDRITLAGEPESEPEVNAETRAPLDATAEPEDES